MLIIENVCLSDDIKDSHFVCDLEACKGACCEEGDAGAPLDEAELEILENIYPEVLPYLPVENRDVIALKGMYEKDTDGEYCTTMAPSGACVFAIKINGTWQCAIEKAHRDGKIAFKKPISCHLYPIRLTRTHIFELVNYHRWRICSPACTLGAQLKVPLFQFLKEPLTRKFGAAWYQKLIDAITELA